MDHEEGEQSPDLRTGPRVRLLHGDCRRMLVDMPDCSVHAVVTDPPYEIGFMTTRSRRWDSTGVAFDPAVWEQCLRVLKPGGHLLAFGAPRSWHRLTVAVEDAGFEIRDSIAWLTGQGMPKSLDVGKAIHRHCAKQWVAGQLAAAESKPEDAADWVGYGTNLKPSHEPIILARKPMVVTVAANVLAHSAGVLNVDACRVGEHRRWPTNVVMDSAAAAELDEQSGILRSGRMAAGTIRAGDREAGRAVYGQFTGVATVRNTPGDTGGASRFFPVFRYTAKAPASERPCAGGVVHTTVKPLTLMRWLVRLVTPAGGTVLDPFAGSGTTVEASLLEGFSCIAIEQAAEYLPLIEHRITRAS